MDIQRDKSVIFDHYLFTLFTFYCFGFMVNAICNNNQLGFVGWYLLFTGYIIFLIDNYKYFVHAQRRKINKELDNIKLGEYLDK